MDDAGCESAVVLAPVAGAMPALWLAATHPERVASLVLVNGTARIGWAEDYTFGVAAEVTARGSDIDVPILETASLATSPPSPRAWPTGSASGSGGSGRPGAGPARPRRIAFNVVTFSADLRWCLPSVTCPTLSVARTDSCGQPGRARPLPGPAHRRGAASSPCPGPTCCPGRASSIALVDEIEEFVTGTRSAPVGDPPAVDRPLHRHRGLDGAGRRAR